MRKKNLIICCTPLHVIIAERIIQLHPDEEFYGIIYSPVEPISMKYAHYAHRLEKKCGHTIKILYPIYKQGQFKAIWRSISNIYQAHKVQKFDCIFSAHFLHEEISYLIYQQKHAEIKTFDDGSMNLMLRSNQQDEHDPKGRLYHLLTNMFRIPAEKEILNKRTEHFTIYRQKNIINAPKMTFINLLGDDIIEVRKLYTGAIKASKEISIFLGQPIYEFEVNGTERNITMTQNLINSLRIKYYYPHPRERYKIHNIEYINSPLIFEDYLLRELKHNKETRYKVYTFCSSTLLNLQDVPNVEFTAFLPSDCPTRLLETYDLVRNCNIPIVEINSHKP